MKKKSNQRITKIKIDQIKRLLERAEDIPVEDACVINPATDQLTTYPDMDNLRTWTRDNLTKGLNKILLNKFDSNGQTYMTTLVDGLPLFTKMSKTLSTSKYIDIYAFNDTITVTNNTSIDPETGIISYPQSNSSLYFATPRSIHANGTFTIVFKLTSIDNISQAIFIFAMGSRSSSGLSVSSSGFFDHSSGKFCCDFSNSNPLFSSSKLSPNTWYTFSFSVDSNYNITVNLISEDGIKLIDNQICNKQLGSSNTSLSIGHQNVQNLQVDATKCSFGNESNTILLYKTDQQETTINYETSKPGLWLSNLNQPISGSSAGSWLRSNLINSNADKYNFTNLDTIGNYSNTFTQPAIISSNKSADYTRDCSWWKDHWSGTENAVVYNQHYSPSYFGSISYVNQPSNDARWSLPGFKFEYKYSSYQTIAFPQNPDAQLYTESEYKCLRYPFVGDNSSSSNKYNDMFYLRAPNSTQTPESLNNTLTLKPDNSTGGSITGSLISVDDDNNICETDINYIFRSVQAMFNSNYTYNQADNSLDNTTIKPIKAFTKLNACCFYHYAQTGANGEYYLMYGRYRFTYTAHMESGHSCNGVYYEDSEGNGHYGFSSGNNSIWYNQTTGGSATCGRDSNAPSVDYNSSGWCGAYYGRLDGYVLPGDSSITDQNNINIYLHVKDLAAESRANGVPFKNPDCTLPAFSIYVNINPVAKNYEKVYLIAENVSIDALGNISTINNKIIELL